MGIGVWSHSAKPIILDIKSKNRSVPIKYRGSCKQYRAIYDILKNCDLKKCCDLFEIGFCHWFPIKYATNTYKHEIYGTLLHLACWLNQVALINFLLHLGSSVHSFASCGNTPIHYLVFGHFATNENIVECLNILQKHPSVDLDIVNKNGETVLMKSIAKKKFIVALFLLSLGVNALKVDNNRRNALHILCLININEFLDSDIEQKKELMLTLLSHGININDTDSLGYTPLHHAMLTHNWLLALKLLSYGAHPDIKDENGRSCLFLLLNQISGVEIAQIFFFKTLNQCLHESTIIDLRDNLGNIPDYINCLLITQEKYLLNTQYKLPSLKMCCRKIIRQALLPINVTYYNLTKCGLPRALIDFVLMKGFKDLEQDDLFLKKSLSLKKVLNEADTFFNLFENIIRLHNLSFGKKNYHYNSMSQTF